MNSRSEAAMDSRPTPIQSYSTSSNPARSIQGSWSSARQHSTKPRPHLNLYKNTAAAASRFLRPAQPTTGKPRSGPRKEQFALEALLLCVANVYNAREASQPRVFFEAQKEN